MPKIVQGSYSSTAAAREGCCSPIRGSIPRKEMSEEKKERIVQLYRDGMSIEQIGTQIYVGFSSGDDIFAEVPTVGEAALRVIERVLVDEGVFKRVPHTPSPSLPKKIRKPRGPNKSKGKNIEKSNAPVVKTQQTRKQQKGK